MELKQRMNKGFQKKNLQQIQKDLNIHFNNEHLLEMSLTHSSYSSSKENIKDNQRLELLGDSVLGLMVTEYLYLKFQDYQEGKITKIKNYLVSQPVLSKLARAIRLGTYLIMSPAEEMSGGRNKDSSLADVFEAIIGAIYLDKGLDAVREFFIPKIEPEIHLSHSDTFVSDYKSELQYLVQKKLKICPEYVTLNEIGPNHRKVFTVGLHVNGVCYAQGEAKSKKQAEQNAAEIVYKKVLKGELSF